MAIRVVAGKLAQLGPGQRGLGQLSDSDGRNGESGVRQSRKEALTVAPPLCVQCPDREWETRGGRSVVRLGWVYVITEASAG